MAGFGEKTGDSSSTNIETTTTTFNGGNFNGKEQIQEEVNSSPTQRPQESTSNKSESSDDDDHKDDLPLSKARCIALVATVTGASFLNVRTISFFKPSFLNLVNSHTLSKNRPSQARPSSSFCRRLAGTSTSPTRASSGSSRRTS